MHHCSLHNSRWQSFLIRNLKLRIFFCTTALTGFPRLQELCEIVSTPIGGLDDLESKLNTYRASLTPSLVTQVIKSCRDEAPSRRLLRFFVWSNNNLKTDLSDRDYNHALRIFAGKKDHTALEILLSDLERDGRAMEAGTYSAVAEVLVKLRKPDEAVRLFKNLENYNCPQDGSTVAAIVGELCAHGHAERAEAIMNKHRERIKSGAGRIWVSKSLLYAWAEREDPKEARKVIQEMKYSGITPDLFCYNAFLRCLCERNLKRNPSGLVPEALNVVMEMRTQNVAPDSISYNVLLSCLGRARRAKESCQILERMKETGCDPDCTSYYLVVRVLYRGSRFGKGNTYLEEMRERGLVPNRKFYYGLIGVLCKVHRPNYALDLLARMKESELGGYGPVYDVIISKLCSSGDFEKAKELWDEAANMGVEIQCSRDVFDPKVICGNPKDVPFVYSKDCAKSKKKKSPTVKVNIQEELSKKKLEKKIAVRNKNKRKPFEKEIAAIRKKNQQKHFKNKTKL